VVRRIVGEFGYNNLILSDKFRKLYIIQRIFAFWNLVEVGRLRIETRSETQ
jgi:hypothetical protein